MRQTSKTMTSASNRSNCIALCLVQPTTRQPHPPKKIVRISLSLSLHPHSRFFFLPTALLLLQSLAMPAHSKPHPLDRVLELDSPSRADSDDGQLSSRPPSPQKKRINAADFDYTKSGSIFDYKISSRSVSRTSRGLGSSSRHHTHNAGTQRSHPPSRIMLSSDDHVTEVREVDALREQVKNLKIERAKIEGELKSLSYVLFLYLIFYQNHISINPSETHTKNCLRSSPSTSRALRTRSKN